MQPRAFPRYAAEVAVTMSHQGTTARGTTTNLSSGGLCAVVDRGFAMGTDVVASVALIFSDDALSEPLELEARVVWSTELENGHQVGISFLAMDSEKRSFLDLFLRYLSGEE